MTTTEQIINHLVEVSRPLILEKYRPDSCIASTRIGLDVLRHFKIEAKAQTVSLMVFNDKLWRRVKKTPSGPIKPFRPGEWSVGVGYGYNPRHDAQMALDGHLIIVAESDAENEILIDLSLDQCSRPERKLNVHPIAQFVPSTWRTKQLAITVGDSHCVYNPITTRPYQHSPDWIPMSDTAPMRDAIVGKIVAEIEAKLLQVSHRA